MEKNNKLLTKTFSLTVTNEVWKKIKILSVQKEITFSEQAVQLIEKELSRKKVDAQGETG